jgi:hypothetical protein
MDLTRAVGKAGVPAGVVTSDTSGTVQTSDKTDHDFAPPLHAAVMILAFVVLMPLGVLILRILNSPKWHGFNQALSAVVAIIGLFLGIYISTMYNRVSTPRPVKNLPNLFADQKLSIGTSNFRHSHHPCNDCAVHPWLLASSNL